jgi:hypothetical protein
MLEQVAVRRDAERREALRRLAAGLQRLCKQARARDRPDRRGQRLAGRQLVV